MEQLELWAFLKKHGIVSSGGEAKHYIRDGNVRVNGTVETRVRKKLSPGDVIECEGKRHTI